MDIATKVLYDKISGMKKPLVSITPKSSRPPTQALNIRKQRGRKTNKPDFVARVSFLRTLQEDLILIRDDGANFKMQNKPIRNSANKIDTGRLHIVMWNLSGWRHWTFQLPIT